MRRNTFDESAPNHSGAVVVNPPLPCRSCTKRVLPKYLMNQGGLCGECYGVYQERGNVGLGILRPAAGAQA